MSLSNLNNYVGAISQRLGTALGQVAPGIMAAPDADQHLAALARQQAQQDAAFSDYAMQRLAANPFVSSFAPGAPAPQWQMPGAYQPLAPAPDQFGAYLQQPADLNAYADQQIYSRLGQNPSNPYAPGPTASTSGKPQGAQNATTAATEAGATTDQALAPYWQDIAQSAAQYGEDPTLLAAIIKEESGGDPHAVSSAGALGLGQVMPGEFQPGEDWRDPATNIRVAARVLAEKYAANGQDWDMAVRGYHGFGSDGNTTDQQYLAAVKANQREIQRGLQQTAPGPGQAGGAATGAAVAAGAVTGGVVGHAMSLVGTPYAFGGGIRQSGNPADGVDCSSFTGYVLNLPANLWNAQAQYDASQKVDRSQLQPGDLVFFTGTYDAGVPVTHVGIYLGNDRMVSAIDNGVAVSDLADPYWVAHFYSAGRISQ